MSRVYTSPDLQPKTSPAFSFHRSRAQRPTSRSPSRTKAGMTDIKSTGSPGNHHPSQHQIPLQRHRTSPYPLTKHAYLDSTPWQATTISPFTYRLQVMNRRPHPLDTSSSSIRGPSCHTEESHPYQCPSTWYLRYSRSIQHTPCMVTQLYATALLRQSNSGPTENNHQIRTCRSPQSHQG